MNKTVVITGATAGIGLQTATELARLGWTVVVTGRDSARGLAAVQEIRAAAGHDRVHLALGDVSTRAGVAVLAAELQSRWPQIDVLIHNAGAFRNELVRTSDGLESCFAVNVMAPVALTEALLPALQAATGARVIALTGGLDGGALELKSLNTDAFAGLNTYSNTKKAMEAAFLAMAPGWAEQRVFASVVYPGQAATGMTQSVSAVALPWYQRVIYPLFKLAVRSDGGKSAKKASRSSVWAATAGELEGQSGGYYDRHCRPGRLHATVRDAANQRAVLALLARSVVGA